MNSDLEIGDYVMLSPETQWDTNHERNPLDCEGLVMDNGITDGAWIEVQWNNGTWNRYKVTDSDLIKLEEE
jgi:hypothetical protein